MYVFILYIIYIMRFVNNITNKKSTARECYKI